MKLYVVPNWFDVDRILDDDVKYHDKRKLVVDYESYEKLLQERDADKAEIDCNKCENRGKINGLSQETFCSGCIHADKWKKDLFKPKANQCDGCNAGIYKDEQGMHRDENSNPVMVCQAHRYETSA